MIRWSRTRSSHNDDNDDDDYDDLNMSSTLSHSLGNMDFSISYQPYAGRHNGASAGDAWWSGYAPHQLNSRWRIVADDKIVANENGDLFCNTQLWTTSFVERRNKERAQTGEDKRTDRMKDGRM